MRVGADRDRESAIGRPLSAGVRRQVTTRSFFALSLCLPIVVFLSEPLLPRPWTSPATVTVFGIVPYIPFAVVLAWKIKRTRTRRGLILLTLLAPGAFGLFMAAIYCGLLVLDRSDLAEMPAVIGIIVAYALIVGLFYAGIAWGLWFLARRIGWVNDEFVA